MTVLSLVVRQARLLAVREAINAGAVWAYTDTPPATPETATAATKLAPIPLAAIAGAIGGTGTVAKLTLSVPRVAPAAATGVIGWVRFVDSAGNGVMDVIAGLVGSGAPALFSDLQVYTGGEVQLISCVISE